MIKKIHNTHSRQKICAICEITQKYGWLTLLQGESGFGKTFGLKYFALKNNNVYLTEAISTDNKRPMKIWTRVAIQVLGEDFFYKNCAKAKFAELIDFLVAGLNAKPERSIVILDEGGFLNHANLRHLKSLVDRTKQTTGYILSGPEYFVENVKTWIAEKVPQMKELETRIDLIATIAAPAYEEKVNICVAEGLNLKDAKIIAKKSGELRSLFRNIINHKMGISSRYEFEWEKEAQSTQE